MQQLRLQLIIYKVVKGDSLWKLGKRYSVTIDYIKNKTIVKEI